MVFSSLIFLFVFLPSVVVVYYTVLSKSIKLRNLFLFLASIIFYAWGEPVYVLVMLLSIFVNWILGRVIYIDQKRKKIWLAIGIIFNVSILFYFKYLGFVLSNVNHISGLEITFPSIRLPIGISFFTFQAMSYVIDIYRTPEKMQRNPINVGLYISLFPQLIAGPIVRYSDIAEQINGRKTTFSDFCEGSCRFAVGLAKKVILANNIALVADNIFNYGGRLSVLTAWVGAIAYTMQIFFDFSGYSDMAIGLGEMFGFRFNENFNYPYISKSISEFWRRWHISLGTWFRDYVYFPLGGSRVKSKYRLILNLFVTWMLTGIWHGANWTFIIWGLMYFMLIAFEKLTGVDKNTRFPVFKHIYTMLFVIIGWVVFRSDDVLSAFSYIASMFGIGSAGIYDKLLIQSAVPHVFYLIAGLIMTMPLMKLLHNRLKDNTAYLIFENVCMAVLFLVSVSFVAKGAYNPFIYFNF